MIESEIGAGSAARANGADRQPSGQDEAPCNRFWSLTAGFIGFHVARRLLADSGAVLGLDNLYSYYDPELEKARLAELAAYATFHFEQHEIANRDAMADLFATYSFDCVVHSAAQAGVRHSLRDPHAYADANIVGFLNILEGCRHVECKHLIYASSSSVYGANAGMPLRTSDNSGHPLSLYGATTKPMS